jgi:hypothetical protein
MFTEKKQSDDGERLIERPIQDDDYLFLQENLIVTIGIFQDEKVIFDDTTQEWCQFCVETLGFSVPDYCLES